MGRARTRTRVFIRYSHDSARHKRRVLKLAELLREQGVNAQLDQYVKGSRQRGVAAMDAYRDRGR